MNTVGLTQRIGARWRRSLNNPVVKKELRSRMRGRRAFVVLTAYLALMALVIVLIYLAVVQNAQPYGSSGRDSGQAIFFAIVFVQIFLAGFIGPAFTAGAISGERERQTYDLLRTTLLSPGRLLMGKLVAALGYVLLLIASSLPLHGIALLLGGVDLVEFAISQLLIGVATLFYALWGLYASIRMRSTLTATVFTYTGVLIVLIGIPFVVLLGAAIFDIGLFGMANRLWQIVLIYIGYGVLALNLPAALVLSESLYRSDDVIWYSVTYASPYTLYLVSPWLILTAVYLLASLWLFWRCKRRLARTPEV